MDVSKSDDSHGERAFPSTGSKKEAVIELLVDCCLVTAGDGREGQERERQLLPAPILIPFFVENAKSDERIADSLSAVQVLCRLLRQLRSLRQSKPLEFIVQIASRN